MVLVCGCSYGAGKALALMPLIALPVVFFCAGNEENKPLFFFLALMRSLAFL